MTDSPTALAAQSYDHLVHIKDHSEVALYELIPDVVWFFDLDKHGWWWGNSAAVKFWGLNHVDELINKDLSGDTQGAKDRTAQTFELAVQNGLTIDPWTTYPNGKPKTLYMRHRAVLLGPEKHRGIIAFINEEVNLGETPENLLLVEAMRYTNVAVTIFTFEGEPVVENPAATEAYKHIHRNELRQGNFFLERFVNPAEGRAMLAQAIAQKGGQWTHHVHTAQGERIHTLDVRMTRHPLSGDFLLLMSEYDVTPLHDALAAAEMAQEELRQLAHYDAVTGIPSLRYLIDQEQSLMRSVQQSGHPLAVLYIDLDGFKEVNDSCGHETGNQVLTEVARRLSQAADGKGKAVRLGGDEFLIWLDKVAEQNLVHQIAKDLLAHIQMPIEVSPCCTIKISASIGVAFHQLHGQTLDEIIQAADHAMYTIKRAGKCGVGEASLA
ncbi:Cyclic di-GMP phosphodiesterase Gmr [Marinomonas aquimarina]|uniref:Cyclic di-GMP phosphodiesterase Gmr n=1 Tax=Marinomonas aquimarina TaxID=295068 RepID=A0A1A8TDQ1_9GAMM|nr:GGDEF domain-containing protein [Marinomonas aquimarina]SBS30484.1 Cyclic di-GMP phosphodiesterase Gmr [Marinomonas aquimarina]